MVGRESELAALHDEMRGCRRCLEAGHEIVPGAVFSGLETAAVMVVGQAPGVTESEVGRPFNASSGRRLFEWLGHAGWEETDFRRTQYMTAVTKCYPGKSGKGDRVPSRAEQKLCAPYLQRELALVRPALLLPVGGLAVRLFLRPLLGASGTRRLGDVIGRTFVDEEGRRIVPLPHPSGASLWLNRPENRALVDRALEHVRRYSEELRV
jgi:uracil-DNA glycosylase